MESESSGKGSPVHPYRRRLVASGIALLIATACALASAVAQSQASASVDRTLDVARRSESLVDDILTSQGLFRLYVITRDTSALNAQ